MKRLPIEVRKCAFRGWPNSWQITNGLLSIVAVSDIGPRIMHAGFAGGSNFLRVFDEAAGISGGSDWRMYGGHRLWHAPEDKERTYVSDNEPVEVEQIRGGLRLIQRVEPRTGIAKSLEIRMEPFHSIVRITHVLKNAGTAPVQIAAWALTVMERGGFAIAPFPVGAHPDGLLPNRSLTFWPYTDLRDTRLLLGKDHLLLRQRAARPPLKIGLHNPEGWLAYALGEDLFLKRFAHEEGARYPDFESSAEIYTNSEMLELESLGPLTTLEPGAEVVHAESWEFHKGVRLGFSEEEVRGKLAPIVGRFRAPVGRPISRQMPESWL